jgi:hypothetical protein
MIALVGPLALVQKGLSDSAENITETVALYLAQDALEFVKNIHYTNQLNGNSWLLGVDSCVGATCRVDTITDLQPLATAVQLCSVGGTDCILQYNDTPKQYGHQVGVGWEDSLFTRYFSITNVVPNEEVKVAVTVSWNSGVTTESVTVTGFLFNNQLISALDYGLLARWEFENDNADDSANGYDGVINGSPIFGGGKIDQALTFGNTGGDDVTVPDSNDWDFAGKERTISFWMKVASGYDHTDNGMIFSHFVGGASTAGWIVYIIPASEKVQITARPSSTGINMATNTVTNDGVWHLYSITLDGSTARVYVDASFEAEDTYTNLTDYDGNLFIGNNSSGTDDLHASLDDIRIYDRVLSDEEITELYLLGG